MNCQEIKKSLHFKYLRVEKCSGQLICGQDRKGSSILQLHSQEFSLEPVMILYH